MRTTFKLLLVLITPHQMTGFASMYSLIYWNDPEFLN